MDGSGCYSCWKDFRQFCWALWSGFTDDAGKAKWLTAEDKNAKDDVRCDTLTLVRPERPISHGMAWQRSLWRSIRANCTDNTLAYFCAPGPLGAIERYRRKSEVLMKAAAAISCHRPAGGDPADLYYSGHDLLEPPFGQTSGT